MEKQIELSAPSSRRDEGDENALQREIIDISKQKWKRMEFLFFEKETNFNHLSFEARKQERIAKKFLVQTSKWLWNDGRLELAPHPSPPGQIT